MDLQEIQQKDAAYFAPTYSRFPVYLEQGSGVTATDGNGNTYLDFGSGIGVNALGYADREWAEAVATQAATLQHTSNLYYTKPATELAEKLCTATGYSKVFFGNSGAEANEGAIKAARKYSFDKYGQGRQTIVTLCNSFHGRTITTLAANGQASFHDYFFPFTEGFVYANANDMADVTEKLTDDVCAVMLEFVQGEGGVNAMEPEFVSALAKVCEERDILLVADEVQTGMGRTGKLLASEHYGVKPDITTLAKALGGGLPIGAVLFNEKTQNVFQSGQHGSTFGGNPVACAGALVCLKKLSDKEFLNEVAEKGAYLQEKLRALPQVEAVSGLGMMIGITLKSDKPVGEVATLCAKQGLLVLTAKTKIRLLPPLIITKEEIDSGVAILQKVLEEL